MYKYMEENFGWLRTAKTKNLTFYKLNINT